MTLQWKKVENILTYTLVFPGREINITALVEAELVRQVTSGLTSGTLYNFTLFTVSENVRSSGVNLIAVTGNTYNMNHDRPRHCEIIT